MNEVTINKLKKKAYVVAPKPLGIHYLLYVDPQGGMFLQRSLKRIFKVDRNCAPQLIPNDTILEGVVVRKIDRDETTQNSNGRLTFVITYAFRCQGEDLLAEPSIQLGANLNYYGTQILSSVFLHLHILTTFLLGENHPTTFEYHLY